MKKCRIASWNINSVRIRLPLIQQFLHAHQPDILCLQETKVDDPLFPHEDLAAMGFTHRAIAGQKSYHGVAILSRIPLRDIHAVEHVKDSGKRHIAATLPDGTVLHNVYIPAGGDIADVNENPKFKEKLAYVDALRDWSQKEKIAATKSIILGDMNIAPLEHDVWSHKQLLKVVSHTPIEVEKMNAFKAAGGWIDSAREFVPAHEKLYSWWSYRSPNWEESNRGRRLDHIWLTPALRGALKNVGSEPRARGWESPSDHVPIWIELET